MLSSRSRFQATGYGLHRLTGASRILPACCGMQCPEGQVVTYREYYVTGKDVPWLAQHALKLTGDEHIKYKVGDPSCWDASRGPSIAEVMATNGWAMVQAENDRRNGWSRVREFLSHEFSDAGVMVRPPHWQVFETCANVIRTLPALVPRRA